MATNKSRYSVKTGNNNEDVLLINGNTSRCPYTPPFPIQTIGGMSMSIMPCTSNCPHVTLLTDKAENDFYVITCSGKEIYFKIENNIPNEVNTEDKKTPFSIH